MKLATEPGDASVVCDALGLKRATYYRLIQPPKALADKKPRVGPPRALSDDERDKVLNVLHEDRFVNQAPSEIYAKLLDECIYLCSIRTMYRILQDNNEVKERRNQLRHPQYSAPELLATGPNQVWSWDITKLKGPEKWLSYHLYVIIDIYSRYVVGWMIARRESDELAEVLISETCNRQEIETDKLVLHSDRGPSMTSKLVAQLLSDLSVTESHSRPYVSDDNPFSESHFKTLKYQPTFPKRFGCIADARAFCQSFFEWYNNEHYHSGIALMTPASVHHGLAAECNTNRLAVLLKAHSEHPERFVNGCPTGLPLPQAVWINPPKTADLETGILATTGSGTIVKRLVASD
ncbi:IS3 family transposase [soil metagenome]